MMLLIARLTLTQLLGQKRIYLLAVIAALPVLIAAVFSVTGDDASPQNFAAGLAETFHITLLLPLVALILGTAAFGQEVEDGTAVYILARPIPRWQIFAAKLGATWLAGGVLMVAAVVAALGIVLAGEPQQSLIAGFAIASFIGMGLYSSFFIALSAFTGRALIVGLFYIFIWEGVVTSFAPGLAHFSIREYTLAIADAFSSSNQIQAELGLTAAAIGIGAIAILSLWFGTRQLGSFELSERL